MADRQPVAAAAVAIDVWASHEPAVAVAAGAADAGLVVQWAAPVERCRVSQRWSEEGSRRRGGKVNY